MRRLRALTEEEIERIRDRFAHPVPGGRIEAAKRMGVDLTLVLDQLHLSPAERASSMVEAVEAAEALRGLARRKKP